MHTMSAELIGEWRELYAKISDEPRYLGRLAGLFLGHVPANFEKSEKRILYVGKATGGPFDIENASAEYFGNNSAAFWTLARRLSVALDANGTALDNVAWSNLCKIGTSSGNPDERLAEDQHSLAVKSLREEVGRVIPSLIVCVAEGYQDHFVYEALQVIQGENDGFSEVYSGGVPLYFRKAGDGWPPILWMKHPQFRRTSYLDAAEALAKDLVFAPNT